ncbi:MAG: right-handed parallel beta-helix repeat-containing protein [Planctomycetaceae bacterium]
MALVIAGFTLLPSQGRGQFGQMGAAPPAGLVNGAVARLTGPDSALPGFMYYGVNAADRGLGYRGSYMTLGGFIPAFEDDLGGFWSADLRSHLSVYGCFFSNVGAVRKQFIGGTLLGVGVYWDYDGDLNQYSTMPIVGTPYSFAGGQVYNQVGISGEWLTDWGNLRSNGYIPLGNTAQLVGPFVGNVVLCENGVNAALGGADLEVGAYIPGLADWAGMISVGGYAFGNTSYSFPDGAEAVPWFGGVYTRLDMTFLRNWDFSLQANNDSFFDWTGFARLTYRMGGSRRRNVPDQMEQPMMRNEHIVRAYEAPVVATNPNNLDASGNPLPWRVFHVDNSAATSGDGSAESPFTTLGEAGLAANAAYDIVYVSRGNSAVDPYVTAPSGYLFSAANQYLIGQGSTVAIPTATCGDTSFFGLGGSSGYPRITNPVGPAIVLNQPNVTVSHLSIVNSPLGIGDAAGGSGLVSDVIITGNALGPQRGVFIANSTGPYTFDRMQLRDLDDDGFVIAADDARVTIRRSSIDNTTGTGIRVSGSGAVVDVVSTTVDGNRGTAMQASGARSRLTVVSSTIADTRGDALVASGSAARIVVDSSSILRTEGSALVASGVDSRIDGRRVNIAVTGSDGVVVSGSGADVILASSTISQADGFGAIVSGSDAGLYLTGSSLISRSASDGIHVIGDRTKVLVRDSSVVNSAINGVYVDNRLNSGESQVSLLRARVDGAGSSGVFAEGVSGTAGVVQIFSSTITNAALAGVTVNESNVDIGRDPTVTGARDTQITNTGGWGVFTAFNSRVRVQNTTIAGVTTGIEVRGNPGPTANPLTSPANNLTAISNTITVTGSTGILITANHEPQPAEPTSYANALLLQNRIASSGTAGGLTGILLETTNPTSPPSVLPSIVITGAITPENLSQLNLGTPVLESPRPEVGWDFPATRTPPELPPTPAVPAPPP